MPSPTDIPTNLPVYARNHAVDTSIVGIDGEPPIYDDTQTWRRWAMHDIYLGREGHRKWIPKVNDYVEDISLEPPKVYKVMSIDPTTQVPELRLIQSNKIAVDEMTTEEGRFFAGGTLATPCSRQIFYDNSVARPTLKIPSQFHIQGTTPHHAVAYKGTIAGQGGLAISARYDQSFNFIGNEIPLMPVAQRDSNNHTQWYIPDFYCTHELEEGEMILILIYDDRGGLCSRTNWIVEYSALLRDVSDADKFINNISLESFYIDSTDDSNLLIPEQVLKNSINLMGKVHYSDGSTITYPVDGNKFELLYLDKAAESVASTKGSLSLVYYLADNEKSVHVINNNNRHLIVRSFNYTIVERDGAYSVKLYPVPKWINNDIGYQLDWYLFTLDRNQWLDVTNSVYITQNSPNRSLNGKLFGPLQQIDVAIDLGVINNTFREHIHPQTVDIRLLRPASDASGDRFLLGFDAYQNPAYGENIFCQVRIASATDYRYNISCGQTVLEEWLEKVYYTTKPQYRTSREPNAPKPNMFKLIIKNNEYEFPIRKWNTELQISAQVTATDVVKVLFFSRTQDNDVYYSIAPMSVIIT